MSNLSAKNVDNLNDATNIVVYIFLYSSYFKTWSKVNKEKSMLISCSHEIYDVIGFNHIWSLKCIRIHQWQKDWSGL